MDKPDFRPKVERIEKPDFRPKDEPVEKEQEREPLLSEKEKYPYGREGEELAPEVKSLKGETGVQKYVAKVAERRILQARRQRTKAAREVAEKKGISIAEAKAKVGAPIPTHKVEQAKGTRIAKEEQTIMQAVQKSWKGDTPPPPVIKVGTETTSPDYIFETPQLRVLQKTQSRLYDTLITKGLGDYNKAVEKAGKGVAAEMFASEWEERQFERQNEPLPKDGWVSKSDLKKLKAKDPEGAKILLKEGWDAYDNYLAGKLDQKYQDIAKEKGLDAALSALDRDIENQDRALKTLESYRDEEGNYDLAKYYRENKFVTDRAKDTLLRAARFEDETIEGAKSASISPLQSTSDYIKAERDLNIATDRVWSGNPNLTNQERARLVKQTPEYREYLRAKEIQEDKFRLTDPSNMATVAAEVIVPGLYVARHWNELSTGEKIIYLAIDAVTIVPFVSAAARGARAVSVTGKATKLARLKSAAVGLKGEAVAQIVAPMNMLIHPVGTAKTTVRELAGIIETIASPRKLPEASVTNIFHTLKLRAADVASPAQAMAYRDELVRLLAQTKDKKLAIQIGDYIIEVEKSPLMREVGGLAHGSPMGEKLLAGKKGFEFVKVDPVSGIYLSPTPAPRFSIATAGGVEGKRHVLLIVSPDTAKAAESSGKLYKNTAELEAILKANVPVRQKLYTRIGPMAQYTEIWLEKPLSARQIAKLKLEGLVETIKQPFTPVIKVSDSVTGLNPQQVKRLGTLLEQSGNTGQARNLSRAYNIVSSQRAVAPQLSRLLGRVNSRDIEAVRASIRSQLGYGRPERLVRESERLLGREWTKRVERAGRVERIARVGRAERPERTESIERVERAGRVERIARVGRAERLERTERVERVERPERTERVERVERSDRVDRVDRPGRLYRPLRIPLLGPLPSGEGKEDGWTQEEVESAIAWKEGFAVHAIKKPYRRGIDEQSFHIDHLPEGLKVIDIKGRGSPQASARVIGKFPSKLTVDVGNQDVVISRQRGNKVSLRHSRDTRGTTSQTTISKKRGRVYHTATSGGNIISRRPLRGY